MMPQQYPETVEPCPKCSSPVTVEPEMHRRRALSPGKALGFLCDDCVAERYFPEPPKGGHLKLVKK